MRDRLLSQTAQTKLRFSLVTYSRTHERLHIMTDEHNAKKSTGPPPATGIFKPRLLEVEESVDPDEVFQRARKLASGELLDEVGGSAPNMVEGQRGVAIVTPGRLIMFDRCPEPDSMPEELVAPMCQVLPRGQALTITAISYTHIEALTADTDMTRTIPFRGFLNVWAYAGHNVIVFEGHPSAFESGVRDCDVLLVDSGMRPFIQFNWASVAGRVMRPGGTIFIHDRDTYTLSIIKDVGIGKPSASQTESEYAELLLRSLMRSSSSTGVEITSGEVLPDPADLLEICRAIAILLNRRATGSASTRRSNQTTSYPGRVSTAVTDCPFVLVAQMMTLW
jgi:hypothetical protein